MSLPTIGVCGFGRCGSSMIMAMLDAGGVPPVAGSAERSYELPSLDLLDDLNYDDLAGRAVKLLDGIGYVSMPKAHDWRMIWLDRDHQEQAKSFGKFLRFFGVVQPGQLLDLGVIARSYATDRPTMLARYGVMGPVLELSYEAILADPHFGAAQLAAFVGFPHFDAGAAAAVVHPRSGACTVGMDFEMGTMVR